MKRIIAAVFLILVFCGGVAGAATPGACTVTISPVPVQTTNPPIKILKFVCTANSGTGGLPDQTITAAPLAGYYLYTVSAYPTAGGTAPDAADVFVLDANGEDLLGSTDGGTTANKGANLIHATLKKTTWPYSTYLSAPYFPPVLNTLALRVANQSTNSANFTIELVFVR
jgi:hypothetical protein